MRWRSATYSVPLLKATPLGALRPLSTFFTSRRPPWSSTAYTSERLRLLTNTVPLSPRASERASGTPSAHTSTLNPAGTLSLLTGSSLAARPVRIGAIGCRGDFVCSAERPCCHDGGAAGGAVAAPGGASAGSDFCTCAGEGPFGAG